MNQINLIGNLTRDVELATLDSGKKVARLSLAVRRDFKDKSGEYGVDFFGISAWGSLGEIAQKNLAKGKKCRVTGSMYMRDYEKDGVKYRSYDVTASDIEFLSPKGTEEPKPARAKSIEDLEPVEDGELPF